MKPTTASIAEDLAHSIARHRSEVDRSFARHIERVKAKVVDCRTVRDEVQQQILGGVQGDDLKALVEKHRETFDIENDLRRHLEDLERSRAAFSRGGG